MIRMGGTDAVMWSNETPSAYRHTFKATAEAGADLSALRWYINRQEGSIGMFGNLVLSNVPGPREPICVDKCKLDSWFSTAQVFDGSCINIAQWSYCEHANLCIPADGKVIPDGWIPHGYFVEELDTLVALTPAVATDKETNP